MDSEYRILLGGRDEDEFIITRAQAKELADRSYEYGRRGLGKLVLFPCHRRATPADSLVAKDVPRAQRLHIVTARHLREARKTIRGLRSRRDYLQSEVIRLNDLLDAYRGEVGRDNPFGRIPEHYRGDGYVSCDRAVESASAQRCIGERSKLQFWYWATAIKYVWRMWSKEDPEKDALKAIDCLEKAAGLGRLVSTEERENG